MENNIPQFLTERQVAAMLNVSVCTLRNHRCLRRGIAYRKCGKSVRYLLSDVLAYTDVNKIETDKH